MTPALSTATPDSRRPQERASAIQALDSRVSWPITKRRGPFGRGAPRARPMACTGVLSTGDSPPRPRIPSVPKSFLTQAPCCSFYHRGHRGRRGEWEKAPEIHGRAGLTAQHRVFFSCLRVPLWPLWLIGFGLFYLGSEASPGHPRGNFLAWV